MAGAAEKHTILWRTSRASCATLALEHDQIEIWLIVAGKVIHKQVFSTIDDAASHSAMLQHLYSY